MTVRPIRLVAIAHGEPSDAHRAAMQALTAAVAAGSESRVSWQIVDPQARDLIETVIASRPLPLSAVVPVVLSSDGPVRDRLALAFDRLRVPGLEVTEPLGPDPLLETVLATRLRELGLSPDDIVVLAAAGSNDAHAVREYSGVARRLGGQLGRPVTVGCIAAGSPRLSVAIDTARAVHPGARVVVANYLLAPGRFDSAARAAGAEAVALPLVIPDVPVPTELVQLVLARVAAAAGLVVGAGVPQPA
ncbi:MAG TPA: cobalamin biosynthesis protein CbiX [Candidatus Lumbricidophila sp.]|nr:cobalamin biosynthesis protein CbiX [Candidatus Lumbricidophila sp.]